MLLGKPASVIYQGAMQLLGISDPKSVIAIGDSLEHDIAGACTAYLICTNQELFWQLLCSMNALLSNRSSFQPQV